MRPVKKSPKTEFPPMRSGEVDTPIGPVWARFAICVPFT
jgi:hypothetical protein